MAFRFLDFSFRFLDFLLHVEQQPVQILPFVCAHARLVQENARGSRNSLREEAIKAAGATRPAGMCLSSALANFTARYLLAKNYEYFWCAFPSHVFAELCYELDKERGLHILCELMVLR